MPRNPDYNVWDEVLVERLVSGRKPYAVVDDSSRAEAVRRLARIGFSDAQIADRIGVYRRSVFRIRTRHGIPAALHIGANKADLIDSISW